jgi:hypothetical protein
VDAAGEVTGTVAGEQPVAAQPSDDRVPDGSDGARPNAAAQAMYFFGVTRAKTWRGSTDSRNDEHVQRIRYRDLDALVRTVPFELPPLDQEHVLSHQRAVESAMRRGTVLPAPFGIVFRSRRHLIRLLEDQYLVLDEGLSFLDGHFELRLHVTALPGQSDEELGDVAMQVFAELRRFARAAVPFPREQERLLSAAFLVERSAWIEFVERADDLGSVHSDLSFDITGPWPAYDFVRVIG